MAFSFPRPGYRAVSVLAAVLGTATLTVLAQSKPQTPPAPAAVPRPAPAQRTTPREAEARPLRVLFLGQETPPHPSAAVFAPLTSALARRGIQLIPAVNPGEALTAGQLSHYDAVMVYGDLTFTAEQQKALAAFVDG